MRKKIVTRGALGFPQGIAIGYIITVIISLCAGRGNYLPCAQELIAITGSEINAVLLQTVLCGILGTAFSVYSFIWEMENWSIIKQTGIYFLAASLTMMPIAYIANWMPHSIVGFLSYFGIFVAIFLVAWITQYLIWKNRIKKINAKF